MTHLYTLAEIRNGTGFDRNAQFVLWSDIPDTSERDKKYQALQEIGKSAAESIAEMVTALECDYERLEELRARKEENELICTHYQEKMSDWQANADADAELTELAELEKAAGDCTDRDDAEQRIMEDPLSVEVRSGWYTPTGNHLEQQSPEEFRILLSTGGPATRIVGELDEHCEPTRARLQAQDWFTQWTDYTGDAISQEDLLTYCRCFYFGE